MRYLVITEDGEALKGSHLPVGIQKNMREGDNITLINTVEGVYYDPADDDWKPVESFDKPDVLKGLLG